MADLKENAKNVLSLYQKLLETNDEHEIEIARKLLDAVETLGTTLFGNVKPSRNAVQMLVDLIKADQTVEQLIEIIQENGPKIIESCCCTTSVMT